MPCLGDCLCKWLVACHDLTALQKFVFCFSRQKSLQMVCVHDLELLLQMLSLGIALFLESVHMVVHGSVMVVVFVDVTSEAHCVFVCEYGEN